MKEALVSHRSLQIPLWKALGYLRGIAILAVVINHAGSAGVISYNLEYTQNEIWRAPFNIPWIGVMPGWVAIHELTRFAVPLFLFLAGHYLSHQSQKPIAIFKRIKKLLFPFLVWSMVGWGYSWLLTCQQWGTGIFLKKLITGDTQPAYFFIPLLVQFYILAPLTARWIKAKPALTISLAAILQLLWIGAQYAACAKKCGILKQPWIDSILPLFLFPQFAIFFSFGIWAGIYPRRLKALLQGKTVALISLLLLAAVFVVLENGSIFSLILATGRPIERWTVYLAMAQWKVSSHFWSLTTIIFFLWAGQQNLLSWRWARMLGTSAYLIFFLHGPILIPLNLTLPYLPFYLQSNWFRFIYLLSLCLICPFVLAALIRTHMPKARRFLLGD